MTSGTPDGGPSADLLAWAGLLAVPDGVVPLLGTDLRAGPAPALLWNGARLHRDGAPAEEGLRLVARLVLGVPLEGAPGGDPDEVAAAVARGTVAVAGLPGPTVVADPGTEVVAAAVTACAAAGLDADDESLVVDLAGCLAVVGPGTGVDAPTSGDHVRAGHALLAGWYAVQLHRAGLVAPTGAAPETARTVAGAVAGDES